MNRQKTYIFTKMGKYVTEQSVGYWKKWKREKFLELNENENTTHWNLWDAMVVREVYIHNSLHWKKSEK